MQSALTGDSQLKLIAGFFSKNVFFFCVCILFLSWEECLAASIYCNITAVLSVIGEGSIASLPRDQVCWAPASISRLSSVLLVFDVKPKSPKINTNDKGTIQGAENTHLKAIIPSAHILQGHVFVIICWTHMSECRMSCSMPEERWRLDDRVLLHQRHSGHVHRPEMKNAPMKFSIVGGFCRDLSEDSCWCSVKIQSFFYCHTVLNI